MGLPINLYGGRYKPSKLFGIVVLIIVVFVYLTASDNINSIIGYIIIFCGICFIFIDLIRGIKLP